LLCKPFYSSSRNIRDFIHETRAQSEASLHREYDLVMMNKSYYQYNSGPDISQSRTGLRSLWKLPLRLPFPGKNFNLLKKEFL